MNIQETIREIKKDFFKFRNGVIAESLRKLYPPELVIFGLNVPQFLELSKKYPHNKELALSLWEDKTSREARIFSFYLMPVQEVDETLAISLVSSVISLEEAEMLAFRVLRNIPDGEIIYSKIQNIDPSSEAQKYCVEMFRKNLDAKSSR